jgi:outer membrane protein assembly factor BamB
VDTFHIFEDFWADQSDLFWVDTVTDTGTVLMGDAAGGIATLTPSDGTVANNDEVYLASANELFIFAADRNIYGRCRLSFVETASGVYNAMFGFANAFAANLIVDDGAGLRASGCILALEKRDGETAWRFTTRNGSAVTSTLSSQSAVMTSGVYQVLEVQAHDAGNGAMLCTARVNGRNLVDANGVLIRHTVLVASAELMQVGVGAKLGADTNNDLLLVDYIYAAQGRGDRTT